MFNWIFGWTFWELFEARNKFFLHCYSQIKVETLNDKHKKMWKYSVATGDIYLYGWEKEG